VRAPWEAAAALAQGYLHACGYQSVVTVAVRGEDGRYEVAGMASPSAQHAVVALERALFMAHVVMESER